MEVFDVFATFSLMDNISGPLKRVRDSFRATRSEGSSLSQSMGNLTKKLLPLALAAGVVLGAFAPAIGVAAEFEAAISGLGAISRASASDMQLMQRSALDLGASTAFSAAQVVEAQTELAKKGFTANKIVGAMPGLLDLAAAAQTDLATAATVTSGALNSFQMDAAKAGKVADIIAAASTTSATDVEGLGMALQNAGAIVASSGEDFALLAAITGKLADANINAAVAGTATKIMFTRLAAPTGEAATALQKLGINTRDAQGNMLPFLSVMGNLESALAGMGTGEKAEYLKKIFGEEAVGSVTALLSKGVTSLGNYADSLRSSAGAAAEMASRQLDNLKGSITILGSGWEGLSISIGSVFTPALTIAVRAVTTLVGWLNRLASHPVGKAVLAVAGGLAAVIVAVTLFSAATWAATAAMGALNIAMLANPVGLLVAGLIAGAVLVIAYWEELKGTFSGIGAFFAPALARVRAFAHVFSGELGASFIQLGDALGEVWKAMADSFGMVGDALAEVFSLLGSEGDENISFWRTLGEIVGVVVGGAFRMLAAAVRMAVVPIKMVTGVISTMISYFKGDISLYESGRRLIGTFVDGITSMARAPFEAVSSILGRVRNLLPFSDAREGPLSQLTLSGQKVMDTLGEGITGAAPRLRATAVDALSGVAIVTGQAPNTAAANAKGAQAGPRREQASRESGRVVIQHLSVTLPGVKDGEGFVAALQRLVAEFDGSASGLSQVKEA
ncbi:phage tail tape measure protein, TP901 family [Oleidesulfovibrio alaskensis G20]|jgi:TP901 family phage tail tape measure protein|uniref:Phage tail tape measure protein, TP901 family n=1 Tax=Oleidesulfovibrio alaskensis (strain ATCC BAA-1058 / DSM 17464 / G20) TaxID=207559 RepID=Q30VW6_OLEA2|nr:phage tail tape measure protein [Oleidesulfovibrio alaskensis]ABB40180.1 phage tail tape measure protein, TP901 family [Oleidesulfovibrio alaskensis G20]